jgi:hypothetical protein
MKKLSLILCVLLAFAPLYRVHAKAITPYFAPTATSISVSMPPVRTSAIQLVGAVTSGTLAYQTALSGCGACTNATHGTLSNFNSSTGVILYTPASGYTGSDTFGYKVTDGTDTSSEATVTITVTSARTTVTGPLIKPDGTNYSGTVVFTLTEQLTTTAGLIPASASVTATLSSGTFSVQLYPTSSTTTTATGNTTTSIVNALGARAYYQVRVKTSATDEVIGVYDIPASSSTIALSSLSPLTSAQGTTMSFVSSAAFNAYLAKQNSVTVAADGLTVSGGPHSTLNFVSGSNITVTGTDNGSGEVGITIAGPAGGGGGTVNSSTSGQVAVYNASTGVIGKAFAGANYILKTNASNNGTEWASLTAGTGITVTPGIGSLTLATTAITTLNGLTGATQTFASSGGTCGSSFGISSSGTAHTFCMPSASVTATGAITASGTQQVIAGEKLFTGFANDDVPTIIRQKSSGSETLTQWQNAGGSVTTGEHSIYGAWHRTLNAGVSEGAPTSLLNNGYIAKFYETSIGDCATQPCKGLRTSIAYVGATTATSFVGITGAVDLAESGNLTDTNSASILATMTHTGSATATAAHGMRSLISNSAGTLTTGYGVKVEPAVYGGTVVSLFDFYGKAVEVTSGTLANKYGLYLESQTAGSSLNYAIYTNSGHNSFGDAVSIRGISAPAVSAADSGKLYYDSTADKLKLSENGGAFGFVANYLEGSATLDFASVSANSCTTHGTTITVTGAVDGKPVWLGFTNAAYAAGVQFSARVSASNTVSVTACNMTGSGVDPASGTFTARVGQ